MLALLLAVVIQEKTESKQAIKPFWTNGEVEIKAKSLGEVPALVQVRIGRKLAWVHSDKAYFTLLVQVKAISDSKKLTFYSWGEDRIGMGLPTVKDEFGNQYKVIVHNDFSEKIALRKKETSLYGGDSKRDSIVDIVMIETPLAKASKLIIDFPLSNLEMKGKATLELNRADWNQQVSISTVHKPNDLIACAIKLPAAKTRDGAATVLAYYKSTEKDSDNFLVGDITEIPEREIFKVLNPGPWVTEIEYKSARYFVANQLIAKTTRSASEELAAREKTKEVEKQTKQLEKEMNERIAAEKKAKLNEKKKLEDEDKAAELLKHAKRWLAEGDKDLAKKRLDDLLKRFPTSQAAPEAKKLLEEIGK